MRIHLPVLLVLVLALPAAGASQKAPGVADVAHLDLAISSPTNATLQLDQTWEGERAGAMRQSLDAYFGNGDGALSADEVAKVASAAARDMASHAFPAVVLDGVPATVENVTVTMDGAQTNDTSTPFVLHHVAQLTLKPADGDRHVVSLSPLWNGTFAVHATPGSAFDDGTDTAQGPLALGQEIRLTFGPAAPAAPVPSPSPAPVPAPSEQAAASPSPARHSVPAPGVAALAALGAALALALRRRR